MVGESLAADHDVVIVGCVAPVAAPLEAELVERAPHEDEGCSGREAAAPHRAAKPIAELGPRGLEEVAA